MHRWLTLAVVASAVATFATLMIVTAPYGRYGRPGWGPTVGPRTGWILMESPAVFAFAWIFAQGSFASRIVPLLLLTVWQSHYVYRTFVFPFRVRSRRVVPLSIALSGFVYNTLNAYVNARWISELTVYSSSWLLDPRFISGTMLFMLGWGINQHSDHVLLNIRKPGETIYAVPTGGAYRWVSCPNYLGEVIEWLGWACMTWSLAGLSFFVFTTANLVPRALAHHRWYRERFADYPQSRKAILPGLL